MNRLCKIGIVWQQTVYDNKAVAMLMVHSVLIYWQSHDSKL
jgi:hypothetical protein